MVENFSRLYDVLPHLVEPNINQLPESGQGHPILASLPPPATVSFPLLGEFRPISRECVTNPTAPSYARKNLASNANHEGRVSDHDAC